MTLNKVEPSNVLTLDYLQGADHGIGALRVCFRVVITLVDVLILYKDVGGAATINSKKDTTEVIKETIFDWWTEDLETINKSKMVITKLDDGQVVCSLVNRELPINLLLTVMWCPRLRYT